MNRLNLDFSLTTLTERKDFLDTYLKSETFEKKPLTRSEIEKISNYLLWSKDENGVSLEELGNFHIDTKSKTWDPKNEESLDQLLESPTFQEGALRQKAVPLHIKKEKFSREEALQNSPSYLREEFINLFREIDETDAKIYYAQGKTPRPDLLKTFTPQELKELERKGKSLTPYELLKTRHLLVSLRRQQYTLRDFYRPSIQSGATYENFPQSTSLFLGEDIPVLPISTISTHKPLSLIFRPFSEIYPENYTQEEIQKIIQFYWSYQNREISPNFYFSFKELEHVYQLIYLLQEFDEDLESLDTNQKNFLKTFNYYVENSRLSPAQKEILQLKIQKKSNKEISFTINNKYNKRYGNDYISDIFRKQIIPEINATAQFHEELLTSLPYPEEFKRCRVCGQPLLIHERNFVKSARAKDGFVNRCKVCDKAYRQQQKAK